MIVQVAQKDKDRFNLLASHPLQSWEWGEFRIRNGIEVVRLARLESGKIIETAQISLHPVPFTRYFIGYFPKGSLPSLEMLRHLLNFGRLKPCIFIKLEPDVINNETTIEQLTTGDVPLVPSPHPLFTRYTFRLSLDNSEEELLASCHPKTRYNIRVALKHGVKVEEDNSPEAFQEYLRLLKETTLRQKFYAHDEKYHRLMWDTLRPSGIARLLTASVKHEGKKTALVAWIVFVFNGVIYYPYGASSSLLKKTMASNLMMWEAIRFGKKKGAKVFDMWGSLGPDPDPKDPWYGFHRFKKGYNPKLVEFIGSRDLVTNPFYYKVYNLSHFFRNIFLNIKANFRR